MKGLIHIAEGNISDLEVIAIEVLQSESYRRQ